MENILTKDEQDALLNGLPISEQTLEEEIFRLDWLAKESLLFMAKIYMVDVPREEVNAFLERSVGYFESEGYKLINDTVKHFYERRVV